LMLFIFLVLFPKVFSFPGISRFLAVLIFLTVSLLVNFLFNLFVATCAFFVTDIKLFHNSLFLIVDFLAGGQIPIDLMPGFLKIVGNFLPFQFMVFFPVKIYQGDFNLSQVFQGILVCFVWIIFLTYILRIFWLKGVKKYEAVGQ